MGQVETGPEVGSWPLGAIALGEPGRGRCPVSHACPAVWGPGRKAAGAYVSLMRDGLFLLAVAVGFISRPGGLRMGSRSYTELTWGSVVTLCGGGKSSSPSLWSYKGWRKRPFLLLTSARSLPGRGLAMASQCPVRLLNEHPCLSHA